MPWELTLALVIAIPIILFPAAYVWYINIGGVADAIKDARAARFAREKAAKVKAEIAQELEYQNALTDDLKRHQRRR